MDTKLEVEIRLTDGQKHLQRDVIVKFTVST